MWHDPMNELLISEMYERDGDRIKCYRVTDFGRVIGVGETKEEAANDATERERRLEAAMIKRYGPEHA